ncbi:MAG: pentapeptide repeat-containing protein [Myxococcales bacterium]|nr:pentapeptide repeat-containing protein [Myxococcales bacterium]
MLNLGRRPPERVPLVTSPSLSGTTFTTKLPSELISTELAPELAPERVRSAADRAGLVDCLVAVVKLSLTLDPNVQRAAVPKQEADWLSGEFFQDDDPAGLLLYGGDFAPYKRLVDVTLSPPARLSEVRERVLELGPLRRMRTNGGIQDFGPLHPLQPPRSQLLGTFDEAWLRDRWPYFPGDFDFNYFNAAPVEQRMERLRGDERLTLQGFLPEELQTRLPGIAVRAFAQYARTAGYRFQEIALRLDTLHVDLKANSLQLVSRGQLPITNALAPELTHVYACADRLAAPMPLRFARQQFARLLERDDPDDDEVASSVAGIPRRFGLTSAQRDAEDNARRRGLKAQLAPAGGVPHRRPSAPPAVTREQLEQLVTSGASLEDRDFTGCDFRDLDLAGRSLKNCILTAAELSRSVMKDACLEAAVLSHARLVASDLRGCNLREANLSSADLSNAELDGARLECALLNRANLSGANLRGADLSHAILTECLLEGADLTQADLSGADLSEALAARAVFRKAKLEDTVAYDLFAPEANFEDAIATRLRAGEADLHRASLQGLDATGSNLEGSNLEHACLDLATFDDATLAHCNLSRAKLRRLRARCASFRHACLAGADLRGADLMQSNFERSDLRDADLRSSNLFEIETLDAELDRVRISGADTSGSKLSHPVLGIKE